MSRAGPSASTENFAVAGLLALPARSVAITENVYEPVSRR
jgi:hypothetical protein